MIPLWKIEQDFYDSLESAKNTAMYDGITVRDLLNLGFNNNYLKLYNDKEIGLGYIDEKGNYSKKLTEEQLNVKVYMEEDFGWDGEDTDSDGYHIAKVYCLTLSDEELFENSNN